MTTMHQSTFDYLKPTEDQLARMQNIRAAGMLYATTLERTLPDGPDKTYVLRLLRTVGMWANVALTRHPDGSPRAASDPMPAYPASHPAPGDLGSVPL